MQKFIYKDVSVANCHIGGRVCVQLVTKFLMFYLERHVYTQICRYETHVRVRVLKDECLHTF